MSSIAREVRMTLSRGSQALSDEQKTWVNPILATIRRKTLQIIGLEPQVRAREGIAHETVCGWSYCPQLLDRNSTVISAGPGLDLGFELELARQTSAEVYVVDPTVTREDLQVIYALPDALHVNTHALTHEDGEILFYPTYQNGEIRRTKRSTSPIHGTELIADRVQSYSVGSILRLNDMEKIDLLKLDIGGAEYDVIDDMLRSSIQPKQLLVEFHHRYSPFRVSDTERALRSLKRAGYQLFSVSDSMREYSFLLSERGNN